LIQPPLELLEEEDELLELLLEEELLEDELLELLLDDELLLDEELLELLDEEELLELLLEEELLAATLHQLMFQSVALANKRIVWVPWLRVIAGVVTVVQFCQPPVPGNVVVFNAVPFWLKMIEPPAPPLATR
jgi:hypothetical protein